METQYYVAGRYYNKTPDEWDALPWWVTTCYMEGLREQGMFGEGNQASSGRSAPGAPINTDLADDDLSGLPPGFQTRRAG
jgi:hypothetical protein